jgi:hypothetical protein
VQPAGVLLVTGRNLLMGPRTVRDGAFKQSAIIEFVIENCFEEVQVRDRVCCVFQNKRDYNKRRKLV